MHVHVRLCPNTQNYNYIVPEHLPQFLISSPLTFPSSLTTTDKTRSQIDKSNPNERLTSSHTYVYSVYYAYI